MSLGVSYKTVYLHQNFNKRASACAKSVIYFSQTIFIKINCWNNSCIFYFLIYVCIRIECFIKDSMSKVLCSNRETLALIVLLISYYRILYHFFMYKIFKIIYLHIGQNMRLSSIIIINNIKKYLYRKVVSCASAQCTKCIS